MYNADSITCLNKANAVHMNTSYWFSPVLRSYYNQYFIVQICLSKPKYAHADYNFQEVAPEWHTLNAFKTGQIDEGGYYAEYIQKLFTNKNIIAKKIVDIYHMAGGKKVVFCCWETPDKFCHRHIFAEFCNKKFNNLCICEL